MDDVYYFDSNYQSARKEGNNNKDLEVLDGGPFIKKSDKAQGKSNSKFKIPYASVQVILY